jgi:Tol biopolymer transport system component
LIAFASAASDLVPGDTNQASDIFVYDRQQGALTRVSLATDGAQANALSTHPVISADGRVVAFESLASNLVADDTNGMSDVFIHDRLNGETSRVSLGLYGEQGDGWADAAAISGDGRLVAFRSTASNLFPGDDNGQRDAFVRDRLTGLTQRLFADGEAHSVAVNHQGTMLAFIANTNAAPTLFTFSLGDFRTRQVAAAAHGETPGLSALGLLVSFLAPGAPEKQSVIVFDQWRQSSQTARFPVSITQQALSADGQHLYAIGTPDAATFELYHHDLKTSQTTLLAAGVANLRPALSQDGQVIAYAQMTADGMALQVLDRRGAPAPTYTLHGQVLDPLGDPLAQVTVSDDRGSRAETDRMGQFVLAGVSPGGVTLTPSKQGFAFDPVNAELQVNADLGGIRFTAIYSDVIAEARLDVGMPYDHRCENGPACQGAFHGYAAGQCTDLVLDAFTWGAGYNLQLALWRDAEIHPNHLYQTGNAQDAYDMWRYFAYTGQLLSNDQPYQVGDLVFFDWTGNGEINHVALVSAVDQHHQPQWMVDATGVTASNPAGLAAELPWEAFHAASARGHARWNGIHHAPIVGLPTPTVLQAAVGSAGVQLRLADAAGRLLSAQANTLPGGAFFDLAWQQNLSVPQTLAGQRYYQVILHNPGEQEQPYYFVAQVRQGWELRGVRLLTGRLPAGGRRLIALRVLADGSLEVIPWWGQRFRPGR